MGFNIIIPGIIFQSILIGGGYITGREVVEYFLAYGVVSWIALLTVTIGFFICLFMSFELARTTLSYNYSTWSKELLKQYSPVFEILFITMSILVLAIVISASSTVFSRFSGFSNDYLSIYLAFIVSAIVVFGEKIIETIKISGTIFLYSCFFVFLYVMLANKSSSWDTNAGIDVTKTFKSSITYIGYNFVAIPAAIFSAQNLNQRSHSFYAAIIGAILGVAPMVILVIGFQSFGSEILEQTLPLKYALDHSTNHAWVPILYALVLIIALIETAIGMAYAVSKRVEIKYSYGKSNRLIRFLTSLVLIVLAVVLSKYGVIDLVAKGYSYMAWGFFIVAVLPLSYWYLKNLIFVDYK